jgi:hypothetical protein
VTWVRRAFGWWLRGWRSGPPAHPQTIVIDDDGFTLTPANLDAYAAGYAAAMLDAQRDAEQERLEQQLAVDALPTHARIERSLFEIRWALAHPDFQPQE